MPNRTFSACEDEEPSPIGTLKLWKDDLCTLVRVAQHCLCCESLFHRCMRGLRYPLLKPQLDSTRAPSPPRIACICSKRSASVALPAAFAILMLPVGKRYHRLKARIETDSKNGYSRHFMSVIVNEFGRKSEFFTGCPELRGIPYMLLSNPYVND